MKTAIRISSSLGWSARIVSAIILLQTLYFKFSAAPESVYIFTTMGVEPWGRIFTGVLELVASVLLIIPATAWLGAGLAAGLMTGAIFTHLTVLGVSVMNDGGYLFILALVVLVCSLFTLYCERTRLLSLLSTAKLY
jgi:putative oxidoreductase